MSLRRREPVVFYMWCLVVAIFVLGVVVFVFTAL